MLDASFRPGPEDDQPGQSDIGTESGQSHLVKVPWTRVSAVIPTLNEARNLPHVLARMPPNLHEVIIGDGFSSGDTVAAARQLMPDVRVIMQTPTGNGNVHACGFHAGSGDIIAMVDADGSANPDEIQQLVKAQGSPRGVPVVTSHYSAVSEIAC